MSAVQNASAPESTYAEKEQFRWRTILLCDGQLWPAWVLLIWDPSIWQSYGYKEWDHTEDYHLGMTLNFDNTPRMSGGNPTVLPALLSHNRSLPQNQPTPNEFEQRCISRVRSWYPKPKGEKVVTFFAWNEWCEQAALEPSDLYGYGYLEALRNCRLKVSDLELSR